ncbi:MAG: hypothetical protein RL281_1162, partial [Pseudomonadota bacterium]
MRGRFYELIRWGRLFGVFMVICALTA